MISLEERLKALDEARSKIIHDSFVQEQKKMDDEIQQAKEELVRKAKERNNED